MLTSRLFFTTYRSSNRALLNAAKDASDPSIEALKNALENGADVNITDIRPISERNWIGFRYTALMWATHNGQIEKVKFLIENGADVTRMTARGNTLLHLAAREGHLNLYYYLADLLPDQRLIQGEDGFTPDEIAGKYKKSDIVEACETFYFNPFFGSVKTKLPDEIVLNIVNQISDPVSLNALRMMNKTWYQFFKDETLTSISERSLRENLPKELQTLSWEAIFKHYYPAMTIEDNLDPYHAFVQQLHLVYVIGSPVVKYKEKSSLESFHSLSFIGLSSDWNYIETSVRDAENSFYSQLVNEDDTISVFRTFREAACQEHANLPRPRDVNAYLKENRHSYVLAERSHREHEKNFVDCSHRSPIFELKIDSRAALALLKSTDARLMLSPKSIFSIQKWTVGHSDSQAYFSSHTEHQATFQFRK